MQDLTSIGLAGINADNNENGTVFYANGRLNAQQLANVAAFATDHLIHLSQHGA